MTKILISGGVLLAMSSNMLAATRVPLTSEEWKDSDRVFDESYLFDDPTLGTSVERYRNENQIHY